MTLQERLADANRKSADAYLRRTQIEQQRQQLTMQAAFFDQELLKLDGVITVLQALIAEEAARG